MIDRAIIDEGLTEEELYNRFDQSIKKLNALVQKTDPRALETYGFDPLKGNVIFGSAKNGWMFNLNQFARLYANKANISDHTKVLKRMWGDNFYESESKQFINKNISHNGATLRRFFCRVVLDPIFKILNSVNASQPQDLGSMITKLDIKLSSEEQKLSGIELAHCALRKFLSGTDALIETIVEHLPSPITAQKYLAKKLYNHEGAIFDSISACDANGPTLVYVSRNLLSADKTHFNMVARVFSGTIKPKDTLLIVGLNLGSEWNGTKYVQKTKARLIRGLSTLSGDSIDYCPCGNLVVLEGVDLTPQCNSFTLSSIEIAHAIPQTISSITPRLGLLFHIDASNMNASLPLLRKAYYLDVRNDYISESNYCPTIFECHGEFHASIIIERLRSMAKEAQFQTDYHFQLRESVTEMSSKMSVAVTPNKHNRFWIKMEPLKDDALKTTNTLNTSKGITDVADLLKTIGLDEQTASNTWYICPENVEIERSTNIFTNYTKNVLSIDEEKIQKLIKSGFVYATQEGALCGEPLRGTKTNLYEANVYSRNGYTAILPAVKRAMKAAQLRAKPILVEPVFKMEMKIDHANLEKVKEILIKRRAFNISEEKCGKICSFITGFLPAIESIGLMKELLEECKHPVYPQMLFDHWKVIEGDPLTEGSLANKIMMQTRQRKEMSLSIPKPEDFEDKGYDYHNY